MFKRFIVYSGLISCFLIFFIHKDLTSKKKMMNRHFVEPCLFLQKLESNKIHHTELKSVLNTSCKKQVISISFNQQSMTSKLVFLDQ